MEIFTCRTDDLSPLDDLDLSGRSVWSSSCCRVGTVRICIICHTFPGLDLYSTCTDPVQHNITAAVGCTVDDLDRDLSEVWMRVGDGR